MYDTTELYRVKLIIGRKYRQGEIRKEIYEGVTDSLDVIEQILRGE